MTKSKLVLISGVVLLLTFASGFFFGRSNVAPGSTEIVEKEVIRKDIRTIVKEVVRPDGTKETVTETVDRTKEATDKKTAVGAEKVAVIVSATATIDYKELKPVYGVLLQKPVLFDKLNVGLGVDTKGQILGTIGWSF